MKKKYKITTITAVFISFILAVSLLAVLYYKQLHPYPYIAQFEGEYLICNGVQYSFIGNIEFHGDTEKPEFETLGALKHSDFWVNWQISTPVLSVKGNQGNFLIIPGIHSPYAIYSTDPTQKAEDFKDFLRGQQ